MVYLANALSQSIDADKIATYVAEFKRRGVREDLIKPIFIRACDAGFYYFPSVDALVALRPTPSTPAPQRTKEQEAEFRRGFQEFIAEAEKLGIRIKSMPEAKWGNHEPQ